MDTSQRSRNPGSRGRRALNRGLAVLFATLLTTTLAASPANADDPSASVVPPAQGLSTASASGLGDAVARHELEELDHDRPTTSLGGAAGQTIQEFSPAGCFGTTHDPHRSVTDAAVKGNTTCEVAVMGLAIRTTLHRSRWYGWQQMKDSGMRTNSGVRAINTNVRTSCLGTTHDWQGRTYHESLEPTGSYFAGTQKTRRFGC